MASASIAAATLHDIGYSGRIARTGFHPLDGAVNVNLEPCLLAELSAGCSYRRFTLLDPSARRANLACPVRRPREHDVSAIVKHNANGDGYRLQAHRSKLLREHEPS